jgi:hypothetical protein
MMTYYSCDFKADDLDDTHTQLSSHVFDEDAESCWRQCCRVMLTMVLLSHAGDGSTGVTSPQRDVDAESYWRQYCQVMLATALPGRLGRGAM